MAKLLSIAHPRRVLAICALIINPWTIYRDHPGVYRKAEV
jgi:hypothetical protein